MITRHPPPPAERTSIEHPLSDPPAWTFMTRRIVQITTAAGTVDTHRAPIIFALCNDGTLWRLLPYDDEGWTQLPDIPQT